MATDGTAPDERPARRRRGGHRGSAVLALGGLVGLIGLVVVGYGLLALRQNWFPFHSASPREVSLDEARRRFLEDRAADSKETRPFTPPAGVYQYEGSGSESLSNPPRSQSEGPLVPGTVSLGEGGCWSLRLDYSTNHWRLWDFCTSDTELLQTGGLVSQRWDFGSFGIENLSTMRCRPAAVVMTVDMAVGDKWTSTCRGENTQISGTTITTGSHRLVAVEMLDVGGTPVEAFHFRDERTVGGVQAGSEVFDTWLARSGLLLKVVQRIEVESDSPLGNITYTQEGAFSLVSTTPKA